jgi:hypothetical protein
LVGPSCLLFVSWLVFPSLLQHLSLPSHSPTKPTLMSRLARLRGRRSLYTGAAGEEEEPPQANDPVLQHLRVGPGQRYHRNRAEGNVLTLGKHPFSQHLTRQTRWPTLFPAFSLAPAALPLLVFFPSTPLTQGQRDIPCMECTGEQTRNSTSV